MAISPEEQKWQRRADAETLIRAEQIKQDPARMAEAQAEAESQKAALESITKGAANNKGRVTMAKEGGNIVPKFD